MFKVIIEFPDYVLECFGFVESKTFDNYEDALAYAQAKIAENEEFEATFVVNDVAVDYDGEPNFRQIIKKECGV